MKSIILWSNNGLILVKDLQVVRTQLETLATDQIYSRQVNKFSRAIPLLQSMIIEILYWKTKLHQQYLKTIPA